MLSREQFSTKAGFVMAAAGSAVGLANIWGFPSEAASNGGAAFVLVYVAFSFCVAYPALIAELVIGRYAKSNIVSAMRSLTAGYLTRALGTGVGFYCVIVAGLILSFYAIVAGWMLSYLCGSASEMIGWNGIGRWLTADSLPRDLGFTALFMGLTMFVVSDGINAGVEKWTSRLMPLLPIILIVLASYVLMQEGAFEGLKVYLLPDFTLVTPQLILNALGQAFFSMSLGAGAMLIYGSYLNSQESLPEVGFWVTICDTSIAFIAGLLIIPAIYVAQKHGAIVYDANGKLIAGDALIFQVLPTLFTSMGYVGTLVAAAFFLLMAIAALTSSISMLEVPVSLVTEKCSIERRQATLLCGLVISGLSTIIVLNFDMLFDSVMNIATTYSQPLLGVAMCIFVGWIWDRNRLLQEIRRNKGNNSDMTQRLFWRIWPLYVKYICPVFIIFTFSQSVFTS